MFRKDIENIYTDTVREYLENGYRIYYSTMGGSQGEIAKIDLTNDKDIEKIEKVIPKGNKVYYLVYVKGKRYKMNNKIKLNNDSF